MLLSRWAAGMLSVCFMILAVGVVSAQQDYPSKPIRIVTAGAGGGSDFTARLIAQGIAGPLGQPVIVENRGGVVVLGEFLTRAPADGYGLVVVGASFWVFPLLQKDTYVVTDFSPISQITREVLVLAVHPSVPAKSPKDLIALAKARPGMLNFSTGNIGGTTHLASELFKSMAGINIVGVTYRGPAEGIIALITGEVQMTITDAGLLSPHAKAGKLRSLAVTSAQPSPLTPGLPTVAASGLPGYESIGMSVIFAPGKTPAPIITRLNQEIVRLLSRPDVKERFLNGGVETVGNSPEEFAAIIKSDIAKWGKVIKDAGIKLN